MRRQSTVGGALEMFSLPLPLPLPLRNIQRHTFLLVSMYVCVMCVCDVTVCVCVCLCCMQRYEVTFSMLEIYNERVRDLLTKENPKGGLPVRQTPSSAFFVQGLKHVPVGSYLEISKRMEQG